MGHLLQIFGRGIEVETTDLIWGWLGQTAEALADSDPDHSRQLDIIIQNANTKKPALMRKSIEQYHSAHPRCYYANLAEAAGALADSRLNEAYDLLKKVYSRCPRNVTALYALGHCCERLGKEDDAIAFYQDCLKFKNYLKLPRQRLAAIYFKKGQIENTIREYQNLATEYREDLTVLLTLGYLYIAASRYKNAVDTFSAAILMLPDNFNPDTDPIDSLIASDNLYDALHEIDEFLSQYPDRPDLLLRRASVLAALGHQDQAIDDFNNTITLYPHFIEANINLGVYYLHSDKPSSAAMQFTRAAHINDCIVDAYIGLATAQKLAGNTKEALVSLSLAASIENNGPLLFAEAARLQLQSPHVDHHHKLCGSLAPVLDAHIQMLNLRPYNPELHYRFGTLLMSIGRVTEAVAMYEKSLELNPNFSTARNKLAVCLYETDEKALAFETLCPPTCVHPDSLDLYYRISLLYCDKIKFASSLLNLEQWLEETLTLNDSANISVVLQNLGLIDPAMASWDNLQQAVDYNFS